MKHTQTSYSALLGVVLANLRKEKSVEQSDMASKMGLSQASYSRLESGRSAFSVDQMYQAAAALNVSGEEIIQRLSSTSVQLEAHGIDVVPQVRGNSTQARQGDSDVGTFIVGAALGALLIGLLAKK